MMNDKEWKPQDLENILIAELDADGNPIIKINAEFRHRRKITTLDEENEKLFDECLRRAEIAVEHSGKFIGTGKSHDDFTRYLVSIFQKYHEAHGRYPRNKEVFALLEIAENQGFIHTINDEVIEWGDREAPTKITTLSNRFMNVRKILGIKKSR